VNQLIGTIIADAPIILDGGWGTQLQTLGLPAGEIPDRWNLTNPNAVREVARRYVEAGSAIILTNTFRGNSIALAGQGLDELTEEINRAGVRLSREAARHHARVFASIGPSGKMLVSGEVTEEQLTTAFEQQAGALAAEGAEGLVVETMSDTEEAALAIRAAKQTGLPVVASVVFDSGRDRDRTMMGLTPEQVVAALEEAGADVIGANCGLGMSEVLPIARRLRAATERPIWIKPNAGLPVMENGVAVYRTQPDEFASFVPALIALGITFIGGCCGTTPEFIRAVVKARAVANAQAH
jgi:5-methyltetrahydrofolate--homocysteine methyltransferase